MIEYKIPLRNKNKEIIDYTIVAKARDEATKKYFGEYGNLNFKE